MLKMLGFAQLTPTYVMLGVRKVYAYAINMLSIIIPRGHKKQAHPTMLHFMLSVK